jgi:hypothetical protein
MVQEPQPSETAVETSPSDTFPEGQDNSSPHFRVPLTDRFDYARLDCSARVHTSHRSAKSSSSILSSKDRYLLSPCASSKQDQRFVVVELCQDIRIDTVQLANFEFFSGVVKDFTVRVTMALRTREGGMLQLLILQRMFEVFRCVLFLLSHFDIILTCTGILAVLSSSYVLTRLLPLHPHRFPFSLWQ